MYKANDNYRALAKALCNTNKGFGTFAKVMYNTCGNSPCKLIVFTMVVWLPFIIIKALRLCGA